MYTICNCKLVAHFVAALRDFRYVIGKTEYLGKEVWNTHERIALLLLLHQPLSLATLKMQFSDVVVAAAVSVAGGANDDLVRFVRY